MSETPSHSSARGHDFEGNQIEEIKSQPTQLSLFQKAISPTASSTIELYDAMPKYYYSAKEMEALRRKNGGQYLDTLSRPFANRDKQCTLDIRPARIKTKDGGEREFYPTEREHLIEQALRKLATNPMNGIYLGGEFGVQFSVSELRRELERTGHSMTYQGIIDGLQVCNAAHLTVKTDAGSVMVSASIFPVLMLVDRCKWEQSPKDAKCYVKFNPLVTTSLDELSFRRLNYEKLMGLNRLLSRYLFQRLSHLFTQAHWTRPYRIALDTLVRDSGMTPSQHPSDNAKRVEQALDELRAADIIGCWQRETERGPHNRLVRVVYELTPSFPHTNDAVKANEVQSWVRSQADERKRGYQIGSNSPNAALKVGIGRPNAAHA